MSTSVNAVLGILFLVLAFVATYLMFQFWGYPYDKVKKQSSCPQWKMNIHRAVGFAYLAIYIVLMIQMVPRLWTYQVELPARTVMHIVCGVGIGVILLVKISIIRFFRHFEEMMPALGITLLTLTCILSMLSLPYALKERALADNAVGGSVVSKENLARVEGLLSKVEWGIEGVDPTTLASEQSLNTGRDILLEECVYCHDLKTILSRPRTADDWWRTVTRMAKKPTVGPVLEVDDQLDVTAYLVAITPELQDSALAKRKEALKLEQAKEAMKESMAPTAAIDAPDAGAVPADGSPSTEPAPPVADTLKVDLVKAKPVYEDLCAQCHELADVDAAPPKTAEEAGELVARMVDNGMEAEKAELDLVTAYLVATFVENK